MKTLASILFGIACVTFANASTDSENDCFPEEKTKNECNYTNVSLGQQERASTPLNVDSSTSSDSDAVPIKARGCRKRALRPAKGRIFYTDRRVVSDASQPEGELNTLRGRIDELHRVLQQNEDRLRRLEGGSTYGQGDHVKVKNPRLVIKVKGNIYFSQNNPGGDNYGCSNCPNGNPGPNRFSYTKGSCTEEIPFLNYAGGDWEDHGCRNKTKNEKRHHPKHHRKRGYHQCGSLSQWNNDGQNGDWNNGYSYGYSFLTYLYPYLQFPAFYQDGWSAYFGDTEFSDDRDYEDSEF